MKEFARELANTAADIRSKADGLVEGLKDTLDKWKTVQNPHRPHQRSSCEVTATPQRVQLVLDGAAHRRTLAIVHREAELAPRAVSDQNVPLLADGDADTNSNGKS